MPETIHMAGWIRIQMILILDFEFSEGTYKVSFLKYEQFVVNQTYPLVPSSSFVLTNDSISSICPSLPGKDLFCLRNSVNEQKDVILESKICSTKT